MNTIDIFRTLDSLTDWAKPVSLNRNNLLASIRAVVDDLSKKNNSNYTVNDAIEDASFCAEVSMGQRKTDLGIFEQRLIFSNFGRLVTVNDPDLPRSLIDTLKEVLQENGFNFIEFDDADREYDGAIQDKDRIRTWYNRFFDYL